MFRAAAPGPYDEAVAKATDENLTSEDWGAIMEVCDRVSPDQNGSKEAVQSLIKRLAHRNANVQLYTLELANALSQNCGKPMHRELASRAFTDALLKLANDRNTHTQVKAKILERMKEWSDMFSKDTDLGIMYDAYYRLKQTNPQLQPPSAPQKNSLTDIDRQKEEEELQMALRLSLQEEERKKKATEPGSSSSAAAASSSGAAGGGSGAGAAAEPLKPVPSGTTAATVSRVRALYDFVPSEPGELEFKKGDVIAVLESVYKDWWRGSLKGKTGIFPLNYVEKLTDPTPDELQREAQMEAEVFAEIKNVEKLLTLLSTSNTAPREEETEEISKLYHQTLAIRPKLIKLIEKYSQKKDDFTQLNEKFIKARRDYEALLESSMSHPPQPNYQQYAIRPHQIPQRYPGAGGPGYEPQPAAPQEQRYYTPAPQLGLDQQQQYPPSSPSPNFQRPGAAPAPAPFYMAGAEVPPHGGPPTQQHYPPRDQGPRVPSAGKQPAPIQTSSPPPSSNAGYGAYNNQGSAPPAAQGPGPQSTYGNPQELSTSVYDSPIVTHNPNNPNSAATYSSSVYSPDEFAPTGGSPGAGHAPNFPGPSAPGPSAPPSAPSQGGYPPYASYQQQQQQPPHANPYGGGGYGYDGSSDALSSPPPPQPTGQAPPVPQTRPPPGNVMTPPPGSGGQGLYDARQTLPSRVGGAGAGAAPGGPGAPGGGEPQYKAYVPPSDAPPSDYYRQPGGVSY